MRRFSALSLFAVLVGSLPSGAAAATLPAGFVETQITNGLIKPTAMALAPDGRVFVSEQGGTLRVVKNDVLLPTPFVTLTVDSTGERGLLGVAFDPNFASNQFVYVYRTSTTPTTHNQVVRLKADGDVSDGTVTELFDLDTLGPTNHNGGGLHFGADGKLYASAGENGTSANAQSFTTVLGKILRLNPDGSIPADNPFYGTTTGNNRAIWAYGLRNPFTFDFQPGTGRMLINDVGEATWEEIDDGIAGRNYGWPQTEGPDPANSPGVTYPIYSFGHSGGGVTGCAIVGAAFYNPVTPTFPADYQSKYFFADYCSGFIRRLNPADGTDVGFATGLSGPVDLRIAANGDLYYLDQGDGLFRVHYTGPAILTNPGDKTVTAGQTATFTVVASGDPLLSYQWQRNGVDIGGATSPSYTTPATILGDNGATFRCVATNVVTSVTSAAATLTVIPNQPPVAPGQAVTTTTNTPTVITLTGSDPEGGALTFTVLTSPTQGALSGVAPSLTYTPANDYAGPDSFTFEVTDPLSASSAPATVSITVNRPPLAIAQALTTITNTPATIALTGSDPEGGALTFTVLTGPTQGALSGVAPTLTYTPANDYAGPDSFTFEVTDPLGASSAPAAVSVTINRPPLATAQSVATSENTATPITLTGSDPEGGALTFTVLTSPAHGTLSGTAPNLAYTPANDYVGSDSFAFRVMDPLNASSDPATVSIVVTASPSTGYYSVTPCRLLDTRGPSGPGGAPALSAGLTRTIQVGGNCGVAANATAVFLNVTVVAPSAPGNVRIFPAGTDVPSTSALNFSAGQTRANNGVYSISAAGQLNLFLSQVSGTSDAIVDIAGYFLGP